MNLKLKSVAAIVLATSAISTFAYASDATPKKHKAKKAAEAPCCTATEDQIRQLRQDLQGQIDGLKSDLAAKDAALRDAQQKAADAQAAADKANAAAAGVADNAAAVSALQGTVNDLKANQASLATTVSDETSKMKKEIENPNVLHYKGIDITPGGFTAAETVWRAHSTGSDIPTPFTAIPFPQAEAYQLSEFYGTGRQSRVSLMAEGKLPWGAIRGYFEGDWLGTGVTSNNNQSNSYVFRQRVIWGQAVTNSGWGFAGGQMWSLATEDAKGLSNLSGDIKTPLTIDPNYNVGFVWTRQYGFRVTKSFGDKFAVGVAAENPQVLSPGGTISLNTGTSYIWGNPGSGAGLYNGAISGESCSSTSTSTPVSITCIPSYLTTYAISPMPDIIGKLAFDPGYGHYEIIGIVRNFRDRIYNGTTLPPFNNTEWGSGIGGSFRVPVAHILDFGVKGLYGHGTGRYGASTIADVTVGPWGEFKPLQSTSGLATLELHATPRFDIYANYGIDYIGKWLYTNAQGKMGGYGIGESNTGCASENLTPTAPTIPSSGSSCTGVNRDLQEATLGYWYDIYKGPKGRLRQGIQYSYISRVIWANLAGYAPKGIENGVWTSFRYYLP
jgi:flagellar motility protein MotE (MotC chaperone)